MVRTIKEIEVTHQTVLSFKFFSHTLHIELDSLGLMQLQIKESKAGINEYKRVRNVTVLGERMDYSYTFLIAVPTSSPKTRSKGTFSMPTTDTLFALAAKVAATSIPVLLFD